MSFVKDVLMALANGTKKKVQGPIDQGCTHHIITYKTNTVYIDRTKADLPYIIDQLDKMLPQDGIDVVYFNS